MGIIVNIDLNGTNISNLTLMLGGIIWRETMVSGGGFWYFRTINPAIVFILDRKPFGTYWSSNRDIIVSDKCINYYLPYNMWHLYLDGDDIIIGMGSMEHCDSCLCDLGINVQSISSYVPVSTFPPRAIICLIITFWKVMDNFKNTRIITDFFPFLTW